MEDIERWQRDLEIRMLSNITQRHLKQLKLLRPLKDIEILKLTERLQTLYGSSQQQLVIEDSIQGL